MRVTYPQFEALSKAFFERHHISGWQLEEFNDAFEGKQVYLRKTEHRLSGVKKHATQDDEQSVIPAATQNLDRAASMPATCQMHVYEVHIVYNMPHMVPALCFLAWSAQGGRLLNMEEVFDDVPKHLFSLSSPEDHGSFITQVEHPVLQRPFFSVHPCRTAEILDTLCPNLATSGCTVLELWLSIYGPVVGVHLDRDIVAMR
eukprot:TRINITY_DN1797_c0_g1_i2.p1 TRINITY_DN1797_c0_g1~~TRINITY_DN1797_c0_g1_i2.p1  ORF type:complete len:202 (-),score=5.02 TRINITY_DN1797_c0_g1_i2:7-612(-)